MLAISLRTMGRSPTIMMEIKPLKSQWDYVSKAFSKLDGKVPYIAATGNHDYSIDRQGNRTSQYSQFFTTERNHLNQKYLVQNSRNEQGQPTLENAAMS